MGQTLDKLGEKRLDCKAIFNSRFVVEICEAVHIHYRNLRILLSPNDFAEMAHGMADALKRWEQRGFPEPSASTHIELCRKEVARQELGDNTIKVNLNKNLYALNEGKIFAEGAGLEEDKYIHLKIRDVRLELTRSEFDALAEVILDARDNLNGVQ